MKRKIFTNIIFEQKKYLFLYVWLTVCFVSFICIQSILLEHQYEESLHPDVEVYGNLNQNGVFDFTMYRSLGNLSAKIQEAVGDDVNIEGTIVRNLVTIGNGIYSAEYRIWGMNDVDIAELKPYIKEGTFPKNSNEVLLGSYAARYFDLKVGDKVPFSVTLKETGEGVPEGQYTVAGILSDNMKYYKGAIIVSKECFFEAYEYCDDNYIKIYVENDEQYKIVMDSLSKIGEDSDREFNTSVSYTYKGSTSNLFSTNRTTLIIISAIVMILMFVYVLRGITRKIGLLKALGVQDNYLLVVFGSGLLVITMISILISCLLGKIFSFYLNTKASSFYGFSVEEYYLSSNTLLFLLIFNIINMVVALGTVILISKKASAREAMLKG